MKSVLTIAGSDSSGGAGVQADIKTITVNGAFATSVITALTAQNTIKVSGIYESTPDFVKMQIDSVFEDIRPDAVKTGMLFSSDIIIAVAQRLKFYNAKNIVVDPVMVSTSGAALLKEDSVSALKKHLLPIADIVTPNIPEAQILSQITIKNKDDMEKAAKIIRTEFGCAVLVKGGHGINDADDVLLSDDGMRWISGKRINNPNTHGTGCTLSSAIAANIAKGENLFNSVVRAKKYVSAAIGAMLDLGVGSGPLDHAFMLNK